MVDDGRPRSSDWGRLHLASDPISLAVLREQTVQDRFISGRHLEIMQLFGPNPQKLLVVERHGAG